MAQYQNRVSNAVGEGAAIAQLYPGFVESGCQGTNNVTDGTEGQDIELTAGHPAHRLTPPRSCDCRAGYPPAP